MWFSISLAADDCRRSVAEPDPVSRHPPSHWRRPCRGEVAGRDCHRSSPGPAAVEGVSSLHEALLSAALVKFGVCGGGKDEPLAAAAANDLLTRLPPRRDFTNMHSCCSCAHLRHGGPPSESPLHTVSLFVYRQFQFGAVFTYRSHLVFRARQARQARDARFSLPIPESDGIFGY